MRQFQMPDETDLTCMLKSLGDKYRVRPLRPLRNGNQCACDLPDEPKLTRPILSRYMKIFCDCGIVKSCEKANGCTTRFIATV